jgi:hypothetical protein
MSCEEFRHKNHDVCNLPQFRKKGCACIDIYVYPCIYLSTYIERERRNVKDKPNSKMHVRGKCVLFVLLLCIVSISINSCDETAQ